MPPNAKGQRHGHKMGFGKWDKELGLTAIPLVVDEFPFAVKQTTEPGRIHTTWVGIDIHRSRSG
ncbi:unnamed protein product [Protopolystoma xenopodis]|uniref:Uncharacterized protein n=1 Tax=Protopolystoma xenopodis TaxID=117903 RepID=A0A448WYI5_9PLAT|nr:unnamed protein product [Protopolystoma xenopodis]